MNERIKELRKTLGLTMEKFGERLGVKKNTISQVESGVNNVSDQLFKAICREFHVNEEWLRIGEGEMFLVQEDELALLISNLLEEPDNELFQLLLEIVKIYINLKPESQEVAKDFAKKLSDSIKQKNRET